MTFEELGLAVVAELNKAGIPYMLTGALAVSYHGIPRATHDVDIVILISPTDVMKVKTLFEADFFVADEPIRAALNERSMFNIIHKETALKVDSWIRKDDEYSREAFARRRQYPYGSLQVSIAAPEDIIVTKLDWFKMSDIGKHFSDAEGVYRIQKETLDTDYITHWCAAKGLTDLWSKIQTAPA